MSRLYPLATRCSLFRSNLVHVACGVFVACVLTSCSARKEPCDVVQARPLVYYHKAAENETLGAIARRYDMSIKEICRLNGLEPSTVLVPGQKVFILPPKGIVQGPQGAPIISVDTSSNQSSDTQEDPAVDSTLAISDDDSFDNWTVPTATFIWPVKGKLLRKFKDKLPNGTTSEGINISAPLNVSVKACADGVVVDAGELVLGFGKMVILSHDNGMISIYGHLQEISVKRPQDGETIQVQKGQVIGRVGKSGNVRVPQLHFQLRDAKKSPIDPVKHLHAH
ncbi:MAG: LysM peptidoglycan-binding domain-containing M23 family metallopeptidase [Holosporales bacterium]|nr:LysM peptidoglycan-binding domain-containing M23 family metallopeptidase [Holosporales bacterium]